MGMQVGAESSDGDDDEVVSAINTTPLVDVMLVLLIIFLITIPVAINVKDVSLPKEHNVSLQTKPENINLSVTREGEIYWNDQKLKGTDQLLERLLPVARMQPQPAVHVRGDLGTRYENIGKVVITVQRAGIAKVGFVTEPAAGG